jgi:hypothetical protein
MPYQMNDENGNDRGNRAEYQLSFQGQQLKLNTAQDGKLPKYCIILS